mmetsp:Transcript_19862/g.79178  ORF Transcript_19862/g.79178 Transcript_19862/m.79178 type:complete len:161 (-) Transcript_19862:135-617(-)
MVATQRYHRVPTTSGEEPAASEKRAKSRRAEAAETVATKLQALAWVALGALVAYQTDMRDVVLHDARVNRPWFHVAVAAFAVNCVLCAYLTLWLPYVARVDVEWTVYCPRVIPTMTAVAVVCGVALIRGLWPVWGLLTPLILAVTFMACVMALHFVPWPF